MLALVPFWASFLLSAPADPGRQQAPPSSPVVASASAGRPPAERRTLRRLPANMARALVGLGSREALPPLLIGSSLALAGSRFDDDMRRRLADPPDGFGRAFESIGGGAGPPLAIVGLLAISHAGDDRRFRALTYDFVDGYLVNGALTIGLKQAARRERPDGSNRASFPSGHTSDAFVLATITERHYGWKAGLPAYAFATAMGVSRMRRDKHYLSDVLAGATLGYIVGRSVVRVNNEPLAVGRSAEIRMAPVLSRHTQALRLSIRF